MKLKQALLVIVLLLLIACESDQAKFARAEKECSQKNSIDKLEVSVYGYSPKNENSIAVKILRSGKIIADYQDTITKKYFDSLRLRRDYTIARNILLTDTVIVKVANGPTKKLYGFTYAVKPHYAMMNHNFGCEFSSYIEDGKKFEERSVIFKKGSR